MVAPGLPGHRIAPGSPGRVDNEVTVQAQQDLVGGKQLESSAGGLRYQQAVERVVPDQLGEVPDRLGVLGGDAERYQALRQSLLLNSAGTDSLPIVIMICVPD
jgi:hypothetical protein